MYLCSYWVGTKAARVISVIRLGLAVMWWRMARRRRPGLVPWPEDPSRVVHRLASQAAPAMSPDIAARSGVPVAQCESGCADLERLHRVICGATRLSQNHLMIYIEYRPPRGMVMADKRFLLTSVSPQPLIHRWYAWPQDETAVAADCVVTSIPFLGEHSDLSIRTKMVPLVEIAGRRAGTGTLPARWCGSERHRRFVHRPRVRRSADVLAVRAAAYRPSAKRARPAAAAGGVRRRYGRSGGRTHRRWPGLHLRHGLLPCDMLYMRGDRMWTAQ